MKALRLIALVALAIVVGGLVLADSHALGDKPVDCDAWRYAVVTRGAAARKCERTMTTDNCKFMAQCEPANLCVQASACIDPTRTECGKVHAKCFKGDVSACAAETSICAACFTLGDECARCSDATWACESEARNDKACGSLIRRLDEARTIWHAHCQLL